MVQIRAASAVALPTLGILAFHVGGGGTSILDVALAFIVQTLIALALLAVLLAILLAVFGAHRESLTSRTTLTTIFIITTILALLLWPNLSHRPVDLTAAALTVLMIIAFALLVEPLRRFVSRSAARAAGKPLASSAQRPVARRVRPPLRRLSRRERQLYGRLLSMVLGDEATADRLIEYERCRAPYASTEDLLSRATDRLRRDNS